MEQGVRAALLYGLVSMTMNFANKALFVDTEFNSVSALLLVQFALTAGGLLVLKSLGLANFEGFSAGMAREMMLPSVMNCVNVWAGLSALSTVSIPVYSVIKRLVPGVTIIVAKIVTGKEESTRVNLAVLCIFIGTIITGFGDLAFELSSYAYGIVSVLSQTLYLTLIQKSGITYDTNTMLFSNSVNCMIILVVYGFLSNELQQVLSMSLTPSMIVHITIIQVFGSLLNYSMFLCTTANSALTTTVVGVLKAVLTTVLGFFVFGGQPTTVLLFIGIAINTGGALAYMYIKFVEKEERKAKQSELRQLEQVRKPSDLESSNESDEEQPLTSK